MSGSTDAATIAERTRLEKELREAQESLDDTFYGHAMDSQSNALDDEMEAYEKSTSSYIESLRNSIKDTKLLIENTLIDVMANADAVMNKITELSSTYKFTLDPNLTEPWINASTQATLFKQNTDFEVGSLIGEGGIITVFGSEDTKTKLSGVFGAGSGAANQFALDVVRHMGSVETTVNSYTSGDRRLDTKLKQPWTDAESAPLHWSQESQRYMTQEVVGYAEQNYKQQLIDTLNYPWKNANAQASWGTGIQTVLDQAVKDAEEASRKIAEALDVEPPSYESVGTSGTGQTSGSTPKPAGVNTGNQDVKTLQLFLNEGFGAGLTKDGKYGPATKAAVKKVQEKVGVKADGWYGSGTRDKIIAYWDKKAKNDRQNREWWDRWKPKLPAAMYAKGTLGTTHDQLAITDESWIGEEITLAAGKNGQLQYLKKGSAVMPADISANLVEWGKINPEMMNIGGGANLNMISNAVNKPELNFSFDSLVHVDNCSQDTLKDLEKMVDTKITQFNKQLNQSLRRFK
jgi:peptidoglycan hydrolase-like protein with peptidoglycan-binding domain